MSQVSSTRAASPGAPCQTPWPPTKAKARTRAVARGAEPSFQKLLQPQQRAWPRKINVSERASCACKELTAGEAETPISFRRTRLILQNIYLFLVVLVDLDVLYCGFSF